MAIRRICALLESCATDSSVLPPTVLYNEGWQLRLVLDWFASHTVPGHPLAFPVGGRWYSEAELPSIFLARYRGDPLAESWTNADGAIGHFDIGITGKGALSLWPTATHFVICEAKLFSGLSRRTRRASYFDQAARSVACIAECLRRAERNPRDLAHLGFYVLAPQSQIDKGLFADAMERASIYSEVQRRVGEYQGREDQGEKERWLVEWFEPAVERIDLRTLSWESLLDTMDECDRQWAGLISAFYKNCREVGARGEKSEDAGDGH